MSPDWNPTILMNALRARDEEAFTYLVEQYHPSLVRLARIFVGDSAVAEEVAQETWLAVLNGLDQFEGRSSLKTWIFSILTNKAKTSGRRASRMLFYTDPEGSPWGQSTVDPSRFTDAGDEGGANMWRAEAAPASWDGIPEEALLAKETMQQIQRAIEALPEQQRLVITLRDMDQFAADEICSVLGISETNQRVLLHRARARVREALESYLQAEYGWTHH